MSLRFQPKRVTQLRKALGLTQAAFARRVGVSRQTVLLWEQGKNAPSGVALMRMANAIGVRIETFYADGAHTQYVRRAPAPRRKAG